jgi:hypothetical protein
LSIVLSLTMTRFERPKSEPLKLKVPERMANRSSPQTVTPSPVRKPSESQNFESGELLFQ